MSNFVPRCYIAGPMTGKPDYNYPAFHEAARQMRDRGWEVVNPAENHGGRTDLPREEYFRTDIPQLISCDAILMLPGWEKSKGAKLEFKIAKACGIRPMARLLPPSVAMTWGYFDGDWDYPLPTIYSWPRGEREKARLADITEITPAEIADFNDLFVTSGDSTTFTFVFNDAPKPDPFNAILDEMRALHDKKKSDYTGGEHPLANYRNSGASIGVSALHSMFSRMNEKMFRLRVLLASGEPPKNESVKDSYMDVAILAILSMLALDPESGYGEEAA